jgi:hypothetical protein
LLLLLLLLLLQVRSLRMAPDVIHDVQEEVIITSCVTQAAGCCLC